MTAAVMDDAAVTDEVREPRNVRPFRSWLEWSAFASWFLVLTVWVLPRSWDAIVLPVAISAALPGVLAVRPWRYVSVRLLMLVTAPAWGALAVAVLTPYGDAGVVSVARWTYLALLIVGVVAFARTAARQTAVVLSALLVCIYAFTQAWLPWWGGGTTAKPMVGTFYSANPFGSAMLAGVLLGVGIALFGPRSSARLGYLVAPFCACGVYFSGSRAAILLAVTGTVLASGLAVRSSGARALLRVMGLAASSFLLFTFLTSAIFFPGDGNGESATGSKSASGQTVSSTSGIRIDYWRAAVAEVREAPLVGGGSGSYLPFARLHMPAGAERATLVHNEPLGAFAEGGLVQGLPLLLFFLLALFASSRRVLQRTTSAENGLWVAAGLGAGGLLLHSLLDIGLAFPALLGVVGLLLGVVFGRVPPQATSRRRLTSAGFTAGVVVLGLAGTYVSASHAHVDGTARRGDVARAEPYPGLRDGRGTLVLTRAVARRGPAASGGELRLALAASGRMAPLDGNLEADRISFLALLGDDTGARDAAIRLALRSRERAPHLLAPLARLIAAGGSPALAADLVAFEAWSRLPAETALTADLAVLAGLAAELFDADGPAARCSAQRFPPTAVVDGRRLTRVSARLFTATECAAWGRSAAQAWEVATR